MLKFDCLLKNISLKRAKLLLLTIVALGVIDIVLAFVYWPIEDPDLFAKGALAIHFIFVVMLGLFFWYFQKVDNDKMQEILDEMKERDKSARNAWGQIAGPSGLQPFILEVLTLES